MPEKTRKSSYRIIASYLDKSDKRNVVLILVLFFIASFLEVFGLATLIPVIQIAMEPAIIQEKSYIKPVFDFFGFESENAFLLFLVGCIFFFFLFKNVFMMAIRYKQLSFSTDLSLKIIKKQFEKYYSLDFWKFNQVGVSTILNHVNRVPEIFTTKYLFNFFQVFTEVVVASTIIGAVALYQPVLFLLMMGVLGPSTWLIYSSLKSKTQELGDRLDALAPVGYSMINDAFKGYVDLKLTRKEDKFLEKYYLNRKKAYRLKVWAAILNELPVKAIEMIAIGGVVLIFLYSLVISSSPEQILVLLGVFVAAAYRIMPSVNRILSSLMTIKNNQYSVEHLELYKDYLSKIENRREDGSEELTFHDRVDVQGLGYSYPDSDKKILKNITFTVQKGESVGFIGRSGSGKTTLMNILLRFYEETEGRILVDGTPITHRHVESWREKIGYVRQDVFILDGSIEQNITLGDENPDPEEVRRAVELASLTEMVKTLPDGLHTHVGENGSRLSGGQKQRVGIARALYHKAELLVFDEATSALDNQTEKEITASINRLSETNITLFIVAHRVTTLKQCDKIYELGDGELINEHSYDDLIAVVE
ncbi:MAG: ATP-binding cassette domain-containing protein [Bacteroidetes bacterium]|jgi:ABC-type multidrug transport system fused ATPase/permease subunit|nr:ATP-binding cassette domain-containing protein [Bacteroidota bacterium]